MKGVRIVGLHGFTQIDQNSQLMIRSLDSFMTYTAESSGSARVGLFLPSGPFFMVSPNVFPLTLRLCRMETNPSFPGLRQPVWVQSAGASTSALSLRLFLASPAGPGFDFTSPNTRGLRIRKSSGEVVFDSRNRYMRAERVESLPPALPFNPTTGQQIAFRDSFVSAVSTTYVHTYHWPELSGRLWFNFEAFGAIAMGSNAGMTKVFDREVVFHSANQLTFYCREYVYGNPFGPGLTTPSRIFPTMPDPTYLLVCGN